MTIDGETWFVAKDVSEALGYANTAKAIRDHCKKTIDFSALLEGERFVHLADLHPQTKLIPESDIYRLIVRSKLEAAERFEKRLSDWLGQRSADLG